MIRKALIITLAGLLITGASAVIACDYKAGETKFVEYANCRYGEDGIVVVDLPEGSSWDNCVYHLQAFMPEKTSRGYERTRRSRSTQHQRPWKHRKPLLSHQKKLRYCTEGIPVSTAMIYARNGETGFFTQAL